MGRAWSGERRCYIYRQHYVFYRERPDDLHDLVAQAREPWNALGDLPFGTLVPAMAAWQPRRRSGTRRDTP